MVKKVSDEAIMRLNELPDKGHVARMREWVMK
jgi:hypothetical protein